MKNFALISTMLLVFLSSCDITENDGNPRPQNLTATDGTAVGAIHIEFEKDSSVEGVSLERREKGTDAWQHITSTGLTSFEENDGYPNMGMPPGKVFEYRVKNSWPEDAEYSEVEEGYAYDIIPVTEIEITANGTSNLLTWNESNNGTFINESDIYFDVYRSEDSLGTYQNIATVDEDRSYLDDFYNNTDLHDKKLYYRVDVYYSFELNMPSGGYHWETTTPIEGSVVSAEYESEGNPEVNYTATDLGQVFSSATNGITQIREKVINDVLYVGAEGYPILYKLNGDSWQSVWNTYPDYDVNAANYAVISGEVYTAGIHDSVYVYQWDGSSWSANLTPGNLGQGDSPSSVAIESYNDELYMAIEQHPDYDLQVLHYTGTQWDTIGGDANGVIASDTFNPQLVNLDGVLYLYYTTDNNVHIKHLNGSTWDTDLNWSHENNGDIALVKDGSDLYFMVGEAGIDYRGGIYRVSSETSAEEIISNDSADWFYTPFDLTVDSEGNLVVASMKFESASSIYPHLNIFDGTEWKTISGDFSDGIDPAAVRAIGTDLYYIYGDASTENGAGDPTAILSKRFSK